ncbi:hypothetical protein [Armatimonas sp.]|uniref:hypothetical protein n=1 Tax=Armatimonas sp. TaxID=1872638 RepID=UPI00286A6E63|nr:hypothetical protein [Armatimonas sp.]
MIYQVLLGVGALGTLMMGLTGLRAGRGIRARSRGKARARGKGKGRGSSDSGAFVEALLGVFSPLGIFSLCLGAGAAGILTNRWWWAVVGGLLFWKLVIEPLQELLLRFASDPAKNLEGARASEAIALSRFDTNSQGMVSLTVDGQVRRVLAKLSEGEPREIAIGEKLVVVDVDTKRNTCRVARL